MKYRQSWLPVHQIFKGNCGGPTLPDVAAWYGLQPGDGGEYLGSPDHQNWHRSMASYEAAKARMWAHRRPGEEFAPASR